jgi:lysyl-tRNA synthetase, class II
MTNRDENDQQAARRAKVTAMRELGVEPYQAEFERSHTSPELLSCKDHLLSNESMISYAGRIVRSNRKGKLAFMHLKDGWGRVQAVMSQSVVGEDSYAIVKSADLGDWVGVEGSMFVTHSGEYSIKVESFRMLTKALRPLPIPKEKLNEEGKTIAFDALTDTETRYRQRYVDLALNDRVRDVFRRRSMMIQSIRAFLQSLGYLEVETPTLQPIYGGANARPFVTHHHAHGMELFLRISNELYLKRCIIGGLEKVYEFARDFRNEGVDKTHSPEFTLLEFYEAYADYYVMMNRVEEIVVGAAEALGTGPTIEWDGKSINLARPWKRLRFHEAIDLYADLDVSSLDPGELKRLCDQKSIEVPPDGSRGQILIELFEQLVVSHLVDPHIIYDYPLESSPLCRKHRTHPELIEQFEVYIGGMEVCNAYSELVDPDQQREAFEQQAGFGRGKIAEAQPVDEDFLYALESGMPPTGGAGIGIDRLAMLLTNSNTIKDVLLFPLMKPVVS